MHQPPCFTLLYLRPTFRHPPTFTYYPLKSLLTLHHSHILPGSSIQPWWRSRLRSRNKTNISLPIRITNPPSSAMKIFYLLCFGCYKKWCWWDLLRVYRQAIDNLDLRKCRCIFGPRRGNWAEANWNGKRRAMPKSGNERCIRVCVVELTLCATVRLSSYNLLSAGLGI